MALGSNLALLNVGRLNAFRLNYLTAALAAQRLRKITVTLDGVPLKFRRNSLTIRDVINDSPNTCTLTVDADTPPTVGKRLRVVQGVDPAYLLFAGGLQAAAQSYVGKSTTPEKEWACEAIDDTQRADWRRPFGAWEGVSATVVAQQLVATFAPGYSSAAVQAGLPPVTLYLDGTERMNGALRQIAKLIGGYFYWEDLTLHLFTDAEAGQAPTDIDGRPGGLLDDPAITHTSDDSQIRTRCYGKGHGEATLTAVNAGETQVPIVNSVMFNAAGGRAISEWQRFTYTGTVTGGAGALVGPGVSPSVAPLLATADGSGVTPGAHSYAYTWVKASPPGETLPSPLASITVSGAVPAPAAVSVSSGVMLGGPPAGTLLQYKFAMYSQATAEWSPASVAVSIVSDGHRPIVTFVTTADMRGRMLAVARSDGADNWAYWSSVAAMSPAPPGMGADPVPLNYPIGATISFTDALVSYTHGSSIPFPPVAPTLTAGRVQLSGVAVGPSGVTGRKVYRTPVGSAALLLVATISDNTTTTLLDTVADGSLGAAAPVADTSGLQMPSGIVPAGATDLVVASTVWAVGGGGWAIIGNGDQVIRYTGATGNTLTGIPATGPGAIVAPVNYNSTITGAPMLIGVAGLGTGLREGAPVNLWVQADDPDAQAALAARVGGDGIVENLISDERRGIPSLAALCAADLEMYSRPIVTVRYACFDPKSKSGKPVRVVLPSLGINETLTIQDVTIDHVAGGAIPTRFTVSASSVRTSLEDLLRRMVGQLDEGF